MRKSITLKNGRTLSYLDYGDPKDPASVFFHGFPGSAVQIDFAKDILLARGQRILSFDRPGIGGTDLHVGRSVSHFVNDIKLALDSMGLQTLDLVSVSGGGPYAMAFASHYPDMVKTLNLLCPLGPEKLFLKLFLPRTRIASSLFFAPEILLKPVLDLMIKLHNSNIIPPKYLPMNQGLPACDVAVLNDDRYKRTLDLSLQEAFQGGGKAVFHDFKPYLEPWGCDISKIKAPTRIWHGKKDTVVPFQCAEAIQRLIPNSKLKLYEDDGHFTLAVLRLPEIIDEILT